MSGRLALAAGAVAFALPWVASPSNAAPAALRVSVSPSAPFFGDRFTYVVELTVEDAADPEGVAVVARPGPFTPLGPMRTTTARTHGVLRVTSRQELACLSAACLPRDGARRVMLPPARGRVKGRTVGGARAVVRVRPRVTSEAVAADRPVFLEPGALPAATTRVDPSLLAVGLVSGAVALALAVAGVALYTARRAARLARTSDPLARAVRLLREAGNRSSDDRRRAAALASRVVPWEGLAGEAERVAWERRAPQPSDTGRLADRAAARSRDAR